MRAYESLAVNPLFSPGESRRGKRKVKQVEVSGTSATGTIPTESAHTAREGQRNNKKHTQEHIDDHTPTHTHMIKGKDPHKTASGRQNKFQSSKTSNRSNATLLHLKGELQLL